MSWCGSLCVASDDAADWLEEQAELALAVVLEAAEDGAQAAVAFDDAAEWPQEQSEHAGGAVAEAAENLWDWATHSAGPLLDWVKKTAGRLWEWTIGALEDAWDWLREAAADARDWIRRAADRVWEALAAGWAWAADFGTEKVAPFLIDTLWVVSHLDDALIAGSFGITCLLTGQDEKEYDLIEGLYRLDAQALAERKVAFLPDTGTYVVFSDLHMFIAGDPLDRFRDIGNHELYQAVLASYAADGYTLIENGDVEELWMREMSVGEALLDEATDIMGWPLGVQIEAEQEQQRIRAQAVKVFDNNRDVYEIIRNRYHASGRFVRLVGNHDDAWRSSDFLPGLQLVYPGLQVFDYVFIGPYDGPPPLHGASPKILIAHGHQLEAWNNSICRAAGAGVTEWASGIPQLAGRVVERSHWEAELGGLGFGNELSQSDTSINELKFYETIARDFKAYQHVPKFIMGHTHGPRAGAQIPGWTSRQEWNFLEYTNTGTAGRWEQFIWCATIVEGEVKLNGWTWGAAGELVGYQFKGGEGSHLSRV